MPAMFIISRDKLEIPWSSQAQGQECSASREAGTVVVEVVSGGSGSNLIEDLQIDGERPVAQTDTDYQKREESLIF